MHSIRDSINLSCPRQYWPYLTSLWVVIFARQLLAKNWISTFVFARSPMMGFTSPISTSHSRAISFVARLSTNRRAWDFVAGSLWALTKAKASCLSSLWTKSGICMLRLAKQERAFDLMLLTSDLNSQITLRIQTELQRVVKPDLNVFQKLHLLPPSKVLWVHSAHQTSYVICLICKIHKRY